MLFSSRLLVLRDWWRVEKPEHWLFPATSLASTSARLRLSKRAKSPLPLFIPQADDISQFEARVRLLESGTDARTIQRMLGDRGPATSARCLRIATTKRARRRARSICCRGPVLVEPKPTPPSHF